MKSHFILQTLAGDREVVKALPALKINRVKNNYARVKNYLSLGLKNSYCGDFLEGGSKAKKSKAPKLVLKPSDEWQTVEDDQAAALVKALDDPVRRAVLRLLDHGPMRQSELAQVVSRALGKKYGNSLLRYHLHPLERGGLVGFDADPGNPRAKVVYRKADFRLQLRPRDRPHLRSRKASRSRKEFVRELQEALRGEE